MSNLDCTDCAKITAKTLSNIGSGYGTNCLAVGDVCNPIQDELTPSENETRSSWYGGLHIVPYMGENHTALKLFNRLSTLSPTQGACIQSIKDYALGGEMVVKRRKRDGFANTREIQEVSAQEADTFIDFLETFTSGRELYVLSNQSYNNLQENGNAWIQVIFTQTAGVRSVELKGYDQLNVRYKYSKLGEARMAYVSDEWNTTYLAANPAKLLPVYPYIGDMGEGVFTTLIHEANLTTSRNWYGVPFSINSIYFQWLEVMRGDYTQKEYGNGFTGKHFVEVEGDVDSSDYADVAASFKRVFSRKGEANSVVLRQRAESQEKAFIHSFKPNTDEKFQKYVSEDCEAQIVKSHNWDGSLMGQSKAGTLGNTQELNRLYRWKYQTVVKPWQNRTVAPINLAIMLAAEYLGREDMMEYSIGFTNPMAELLEQEAEAQSREGVA